MIFCKVTDRFRSHLWGAKVYAAASVIAIARRHGLTALQALASSLAGKPVMQAA